MTGQEINEAVARKLGHKIVEADYGKSIEGRLTILGKDAGPWPYIDIPDYCHSIEAAWGIVEHVKKIYAISIVFPLADSNPLGMKLVTCNIWEYDQSEIVWSDSDEKSPMAICLAFLKLP